jgi:predicted regulator of Ras-like GTPase activity (Roadblock/LC7/MglB family)
MQTHKNVQGIVIVNAEGAIIRSTFTNERKEEGNLPSTQATPSPD